MIQNRYNRPRNLGYAEERVNMCPAPMEPLSRKERRRTARKTRGLLRSVRSAGVAVAEQTAGHTPDETAARTEDARNLTAGEAFNRTTTAPLELIKVPMLFRTYLLILAEFGGRAFHATIKQIADVLGRARATARRTLCALQRRGWLRRFDDGRWKLTRSNRYLRVPVELALTQPARAIVTYALHRQRANRKLKPLQLHKRRRQVAPETVNSGTVSHRRLGQTAGCSMRTVVRSHKSLSAAGWLCWKPRYRYGRRLANSYEIALWRQRPFLSSCSGRKCHSAPSGRSNDLRNRAVPAPGSASWTPGTWMARVKKVSLRHQTARAEAGRPPPERT